MKAIIIVTDDRGRKFSGTIDLVPAQEKATGAQPHAAGSPAEDRIEKIDFDLPFRAFAKKYISKGSTGAARFTIMAARLAKGKLATEIKIEDVVGAWQEAAGLMQGKYQRVYVTRAKDNGWIDTKQGVCVLLRDWAKAFKSRE